MTKAAPGWSARRARREPATSRGTAGGRGRRSPLSLARSTTNTSSTSRNQFEVTVDDVSTDRTAVFITTANERVAVALAAQATLAPGSHSIKATWRTDAGAAAQIFINEMRLQVIIGSAP